MSERKDYDWDTICDRLTALEQNGIPGVRDFFATSALSFLANEYSHGLTNSAIAIKAYQIADAMINERKKGQHATPQ